MNYMQLSTGLVFRTELSYMFTNTEMCQPFKPASFKDDEKRYADKLSGQIRVKNLNNSKRSWKSVDDFKPKHEAIIAEWVENNQSY